MKWLPTPALSAALAVLALLALLAVTLNRPDLLVIALPFAVSTVGGLFRRAYRGPTVSISTEAATLLEGESTRLRYRISSDEPIDAIRLRPDVRGWLALTDGGADVCTTVAGGRPVEFDYRLASTRWGHGQLDAVGVTAYTAGGLLRADEVVPARVAVRILPLREGFTAVEAVPDAAGLVGLHRSRRPGDGIDLAGVRPFVPGDRLRRINWAVSGRTGQLHVTATYSDRDTEVVLVLDTSVDIGAAGTSADTGDGAGAAGAGGTVDRAVRAAGSIAEHYLRNGDRVGLLDLSRPSRPMPSRSGRGQLNRLLELLLEVRAGSVEEAAVRRSLARLSARSLVIVLSPLLEESIAGALAQARRAGRSLLVVDTLPEQVTVPEHGPWTELAWQLQMLQRENLADALVEHGVPIVPWLGAGSLDAVLRGLSRTARAPRAGVR